MKLPACPRTKPSGVEWLGDVPEHWEVKRLRRVLEESLQYGANESAELDDTDLPRYVRITDVHENGTLRPETFRSLPKHVAAPYLLKDGDLLFARSGATSGKTFLYQDSWGICAYAGYLIRARMNQQTVFPAFVKYFSTSTNYWQWLSSVFIQSTIQNVSAEKYADLHLSLPPITEQRAIAAFLDRETGRVDRLVAKKRELIERMTEKRTALISRTVTRGLPPGAKKKYPQISQIYADEKAKDSKNLRPSASSADELPENPPLKPSALDWLGDIPDHWEVKRLKFELSRIEQGWSPQCDNTPADEGEWGVLKAGAVNGSEFDPNENKRLPDEERPLPEFEIKTGDFLISRANTRELVGSAALVRKVQPQLLLCDKLYRLTVRKRTLNSEFLLRFMRSTPGHFEFERDASGSSASMQNIGQQSVRNLWIPVPPLPEQAAIAAYLDVETVKLDALVGKVEEAVERLQEYRTALITAAVTGKIDVRGAVA